MCGELREDKKKLFIFAAISVSFFVARLYLATLSSYPYYHGWNEGHYSLIANGYFEHSLLLQGRSGIFIWSVPPFYSWLVFAFFKVFGISDLSARLTSVLATICIVPFVYILAKELYDRNVAILSAVLFLFLPWVVLLSGRVQTDMVMLAFMTASIACYVYAVNHQKSFLPFGIFFGLALFIKQPAFLILVILAIWLLLGVERSEKVAILKKSILPVIIGLIPTVAYIVFWIFNGQVSGILHLVYGEAVLRTAPFADLKITLFGLLVGFSPLVLFFVLYEVYKAKKLWNILVIWLVIYGAFVLARTPVGHQYYMLPLSVPVAILAANGISRCSGTVVSPKKSRERLGSVLSVAVILSTIPLSFAFLSYTGDIGYTCTRDAVNFISTVTSGEEIVILTPSRLDPQIQWYSELDGLDADVAMLPNDLSSVSLAELRALAAERGVVTFLVIDGRGGLEERLEDAGYKPLFVTYYWTKLPYLFSGIYTGEESQSKYFEQHLSVDELK
jgi:4-amino-4-deoxy-L-arabinose transferase-like glycosyltransferase